MGVCYECRSIKFYARSMWKCRLWEDNNSRMLESCAYISLNDIKWYQMNAKMISNWHNNNVKRDDNSKCAYSVDA